MNRSIIFCVLLPLEEADEVPEAETSPKREDKPFVGESCGGATVLEAADVLTLLPLKTSNTAGALAVAFACVPGLALCVLVVVFDWSKNPPKLGAKSSNALESAFVAAVEAAETEEVEEAAAGASLKLKVEKSASKSAIASAEEMVEVVAAF